MLRGNSRWLKEIEVFLTCGGFLGRVAGAQCCSHPAQSGWRHTGPSVSWSPVWEPPCEAVGKCSVQKGTAAPVVIVDLKDSCPSWVGLGMAAGISGLSSFGTSAFNCAVGVARSPFAHANHAWMSWTRRGWNQKLPIRLRIVSCPTI